MRKAQRVTAAKPVSQLGTQTSVLRGSPAGTELNVPPTGSQNNGGQGNGAPGAGNGNGGSGNGGSGNGGNGSPGGAGSPGATQPAPGAASEAAPPDRSTQDATHSWLWWLGWSVSAGSVGTLSWVYRWRRRGRVPAPKQLVGH